MGRTVCREGSVCFMLRACVWWLSVVGGALHIRRPSLSFPFFHMPQHKGGAARVPGRGDCDQAPGLRKSICLDGSKQTIGVLIVCRDTQREGSHGKALGLNSCAGEKVYENSHIVFATSL